MSWQAKPPTQAQAEAHRGIWAVRSPALLLPEFLRVVGGDSGMGIVWADGKRAGWDGKPLRHHGHRAEWRAYDDDGTPAEWPKGD